MRLSIIGLLLLLLGCTPEPERNMQIYIERLANVMAVDAPSLPSTKLYPTPAQRMLLREPTQITVSLLETYQLRHCGLLQLVSERNSILGKVADPFRQYAYQLAFINTAQRCVLSSEIEASLAQQIQQAIEVKQQQLISVHFSNLVWTSPAMRKQFSQQHWLETGDINNSAQLAASLNRLQALSHREKEQAFTLDFISIQETIEKQPMLGSLLFTMTNTIEQLQIINQFIEQNQNKILCGKQRNLTDYRYMKNVFQQQYRQKIQPYFAIINQLYYRVAPSAQFLSRTELSHQVNLEAIHQSFQQAIKQHVTVWQSLFLRCEGNTFQSTIN